jgi:hypothetical protein
MPSIQQTIPAAAPVADTRVGFMIPGAMKCATSTLAAMLTAHPDVAFSTPKEPDFFTRYPSWGKHLETYYGHFKSEGRLYGEGSTSYTKFPATGVPVWQHIHEYNPAMKFVYMVRRPLDRVVSQYVHEFERGYIDDPVETAVLRPRLLNPGRYFTQIMPFIRQFGRERVLIVDFDDFLERKRETLRRVVEFLGLDMTDEYWYAVEGIHRNKSLQRNRRHHKWDNPNAVLRYFKNKHPRVWRLVTNNSKRHLARRPELPPSLRRTVLQLMEADIRLLSDLMEKDLSHWLETT